MNGEFATVHMKKIVQRLKLLLMLHVCFCAPSLAVRCTDEGGSVVDGACWVLAEVDVSCDASCAAIGGTCDAAAMNIDTAMCADVLASFGIDIGYPTSEWARNFASGASGGTSLTYSLFDENVFFFGSGTPQYPHVGCVVSPIYDAEDQASFTSTSGNAYFNVFERDDAEAHNFDDEAPTCDAAGPLYRRLCTCSLPNPSPTPSPTPSATPSATQPLPLSPTPVATPWQSPTPTPASSPAPSEKHLTLVDEGYWRTSYTSSDTRACPIADLCVGGAGGGDDVCVGANGGPYCLVCPSSYFSIANGICAECGSMAILVGQVIGFSLAVGVITVTCASFLYPGGASSSDGKRETVRRPPSVGCFSESSALEVILLKLQHKVIEVGRLALELRCRLPKGLSQPLALQAQDLMVTTHLFARRLARVLPQATASQVPEASIRSFLADVHSLCPAVDQLAASMSGVSGATSGEEVEEVLRHTRSILATARALDRSLRRECVSESRSSSTAKIALSFAQAIAATPFVLAVRHPGEFLPFLGGLDIVNMSIAKVFSVACTLPGDYYGELLLKATLPLVAAVAICAGNLIHCLRYRSQTTTCEDGKSHRVVYAQLLELTYCVLSPTTNVALRAFSCERFDDGRRMMRADYSIDCDSAEYSKYRVLAAATIVVYPVGTLLLYCFVLARSRQLLYPPEVHRRPKEDKAIAMEAKRGNELTLRPLAVLHDAYEPRAWWYELFETSRRIALASLVCVATATSAQLWIATGIAVLTIAVNVIVNPFVNKMDDRLYSSAQAVTLAALISALLVETGVMEGAGRNAKWLGWILTMVVSGHIVAAFVVIFVKWSTQSRQEIQVRPDGQEWLSKLMCTIRDEPDEEDQQSSVESSHDNSQVDQVEAFLSDSITEASEEISLKSPPGSKRAVTHEHEVQDETKVKRFRGMHIYRRGSGSEERNGRALTEENAVSSQADRTVNQVDAMASRIVKNSPFTFSPLPSVAPPRRFREPWKRHNYRPSAALAEAHRWSAHRRRSARAHNREALPGRVRRVAPSEAGENTLGEWEEGQYGSLRKGDNLTV